MTLEELRATLQETVARQENKWADPESDHLSADKALLAYINDEIVTAAFNSLEKWYS